MRVFENRVLRRIFEAKEEEVTGGCRKLHDEELHNLYSSEGIIRVLKSNRMRWTGLIECKGQMKNAHKKSEGKIPLGRPRRRCEVHIKMLGDVDWIHVTKDRDRWRAFVNTAMNLHVKQVFF
jgi:hypothetical protein